MICGLLLVYIVKDTAFDKWCPHEDSHGTEQEKTVDISSLKLHLEKYFSPGSLRPSSSPSRQSLCNRLEVNRGESKMLVSGIALVH